ncbi:MAG TPA: hypothetical protein VG435_18455 [Acidimicrobiales bacterium]|jgi:hypothetical protein|nr:hypothetical protein [Acidimicrobiales bacterium]
MSGQRLAKANALLVKARATDFEPERDAFVTGAYQQLAVYLDLTEPAPDPEPQPEVQVIDLTDANTVRQASDVYRSLGGNGWRANRVGSVIDLTL